MAETAHSRAETAHSRLFCESGAGSPETEKRHGCFSAPKDKIIGLVRNVPPVRFTRLDVRGDRRFGRLAPTMTHGAPDARAYESRADYVTIDLNSVLVTKRSYGDEPAPPAVLSRHASNLDDISERTGIPLNLLRTLEEQNGTLILG